MDQFRRSSDNNSSSSRPSFTPIMRESAFSRPILPTSSTLLLPPKPLTGAPNGAFGSGSTPAPDPLPPTPEPSSPVGGRYKECLRNHAATLGGHVVDGCGEFMPAGPADPMKCAACGCHRSFHRSESDHTNEKLPSPSCLPSYHRLQLLLPPPTQKTAGFGCSGNTTTESSSEERVHNNQGGGALDRKKRFRTKFSSEQKEKMMSFAERVQWRVQKKDEVEMESFCREIGVTRQVLKVWLHNNKHLVKKQQQHHHQLESGKEEQNQPEQQLGEEGREV